MIISSEIENMEKVENLIKVSNLIKFDPFWTDLIQSDQKKLWYISMIISSEIENVEKVENFGERVGKSEKSILRAFARTRAKNKVYVNL